MESAYATINEQRMAEARAAAAHRRLTASLAAERRWAWLARLATRRARRAHDRATSQDEYTLAA
jgi:hypothetical protein